MVYLDVFGIRIYHCTYRGHHPAVYLNLSTGERVPEEALRWQKQEPGS